MKFHLECPSIDPDSRIKLVFDWDEDAGVVASDTPNTVAAITWGLDNPRMQSVGYRGWQHQLSAEPLKSRADMAAIIAAHECVVPDVLKPYFKPEFPDWPETEIGADGRVMEIDY
jgi:hypothetical protein